MPAFRYRCATYQNAKPALSASIPPLDASSTWFLNSAEISAWRKAVKREIWQRPSVSSSATYGIATHSPAELSSTDTTAWGVSVVSRDTREFRFLLSWSDADASLWWWLRTSFQNVWKTSALRGFRRVSKVYFQTGVIWKIEFQSAAPGYATVWGCTEHGWSQGTNFQL